MNSLQVAAYNPYQARQRQWQDIQSSGYGFRMAGVALIGICCAGALTWFMHFLIATTQHELDTSARTHLLDFVRIKRDEMSEQKTLKPQRPTLDKAPEAPDVPQQSSSNNNAAQSVNIGALPVDNSFNLAAGGYGAGMNDGDYLPIVKIAPVYPAKAMRAGMEGNCVVVYTVTPTGTVRDVSVVEEMCDHPVFHNVSIAAALKFRYKPRVIDGEAVEVPNVMNRFIFELEDGGGR